jgi:hypothetical protein
MGAHQRLAVGRAWWRRATHGIARAAGSRRWLYVRSDGDGSPSRGGNGPFASLLIRALSFSHDAVVRIRGGDYELQSWGGWTRVDGEPGAIDRVQRANARYLQRPDADYVTYDPLRTSMSGGKFGATFRRRNARHWLWNVSTDWESPELEMSDAFV